MINSFISCLIFFLWQDAETTPTTTLKGNVQPYGFQYESISISCGTKS
jgi:hypothetical protein